MKIYIKLYKYKNYIYCAGITVLNDEWGGRDKMKKEGERGEERGE